MERKSGRSSSFARSKASGPHGYQSTGSWRCCRRYGLVSAPRRFSGNGSGVAGCSVTTGGAYGVTMDLRLDGKVALVTGGSRGIGLVAASRFVEAGAQVMITSRKPEALEAAAASIDGDVAWFAANVGEPDQAAACVAHTMDRFGSIDILV